MAILQEALDLLGTAEIGGSQTEHAHRSLDHRRSLGGPAADGVVPYPTQRPRRSGSGSRTGCDADYVLHYTGNSGGGDEVIFAAAMRQPGRERVENGTLGSVVEADRDGRLTIATQGAQPRELTMSTEESKDLRLAYAQHVYKAQGRTVDRAFVLAGGWQTDRETSYVALTRATERTDLYISREDLGEQGMDAGAVERLREAMAVSHAQEPSIATPASGERESEAAQLMHQSQANERDRDTGLVAE